MGIRREAGGVIIAPFRPSTTLDNIVASRCAVVNYTDDVRVFAGCLTGRCAWPLRRAHKIDGVRLASPLAHQELVVDRIDADDIRPKAFCTVVETVRHGEFTGFNRAQAAVLEAAILVSRLDRLPKEKIDSEVEYLKIAIDKTAGPREKCAWDWLMTHIRQHRCEPRQP
jgi:hypothetical protein